MKLGSVASSSATATTLNSITIKIYLIQIIIALTTASASPPTPPSSPSAITHAYKICTQNDNTISIVKKKNQIEIDLKLFTYIAGSFFQIG